MYPVSNDYKTAILSNARAHKLSGYVNSTAFDGGDVVRGSFSIRNQLCEATTISLGGVYIGELDMTFSSKFAQTMNIRGYWRGAKITPSIGVELFTNPTTYEYIPLGVYTVEDAEWTDEGIKITAYDNMSKFDKAFAISQSNGEIYDFLSLFCQECGVTLGMTQEEVEALPNGTEILGLYSETEIDTYRDALSQLAVVCCCFATMNRSGQLVLKRLLDSTDIIDEIPAKMRYSTSFSDFASYYDTITVVNMADETLQSYHNDNIHGLTMNLGSNPFLQFGTSDTKNRIRQTIVDSLEGFRATPFAVSILPNPAYDLGDLIKFSGGYGLNSLGCVMSYTMRVNSTSLEGYGENPALSDLRSKTDKEISGLVAKTSENQVQIYTFENAEEYELDSDPTEIISIRFSTIKPKIVNLWHEIELDIESDPLGDGIVEVQALYYLNDELISYSPVTTYDNDGYHLMHLLYFLDSLPEGSAQKWEVFLKVTGGTATIDRGDIHASLYGQGLAAVGAWSGIIDASDNYVLDIIGQNAFGYTDSASLTWYEDSDSEDISENYSLNIISDIAFGYTDSVYLNIISPIYTRITDSEDIRITDDDDVRITDGDPEE